MTDPATEERTFQDRLGVTWRVVEVPPDAAEDRRRERRSAARSAKRAASVGARFTTRPHGWLYFESKNERRRVSSVPNDWRALPDSELEDLLAHSIRI